MPQPSILSKILEPASTAPLYIYPLSNDSKAGSYLSFAILACLTTTIAQMDLQTLSTLFASTFSPDPNVQKMAELQIRKVGRAIHPSGNLNHKDADGDERMRSSEDRRG